MRQWLRHVHDHSRVVCLSGRGCSSHERTAGEDGKTGASLVDTVVVSVTMTAVQTPLIFFVFKCQSEFGPIFVRPPLIPPKNM